ncbi:MAG: glycosyltransferase family 4 protein [Anaerolineae bacterium]|nr:glycosyltransferase family 4 protein [Anaerolineae bacterium]
MKISLLHYAAPPIVGGVEIVMASQATQLSRSGHDVQILAGRGKTWDRKIPVIVEPRFDSTHPEILKIKSSLDKGKVPSEFEQLKNELLKVLEARLQDQDALICHNVASLHKNLALTAAIYEFTRNYDKPRVILWHHDLAWSMPGYQKELHSGYPWNLLRIPWHNVRYVTISEPRRVELANLIHFPESQIEVIPGGVNITDFLGLQTRTRQLINKLNLLPAAPLFLTPVRLTRRKNLEQAICIMAELRKLLPDAELVITGPTGAHNPANEQYLQELKALRQELNLEKAVHLLAEHVPQGLTELEIADFFRLADCLLLTSHEEGFGIPIIEAGISRLIIFCTDLPPLRMLAQEDATYFLPSEEPASVAQRIYTRLKSDPVYHLRNRVRSHFTWESIYRNKIAPLLEELL